MGRMMARRLTVEALRKLSSASSAVVFGRSGSFSLNLSRSLFGNSNKLAYNIEGPLNILSARARTGWRVRPTPEHKHLAQQLRLQGAVQPNIAYPRELISRLAQRFRELIEDPHYSEGKANSGKADDLKRFSYRIRSLKADFPEAAELMNAELKALLRAYYGAEFQVLVARAWRNLHIPPDLARTNELYSNHWHNDRFPTDQLTVFVLLSDATEEDGPFHFHTIESSRRLFREGFVSRKNYGIPLEHIEDPKRVVRFTGPAGSVCIANVTRCLHRAGVPAFGRHRDMVQFKIAVASRPLSGDWLSFVDD